MTDKIEVPLEVLAMAYNSLLAFEKILAALGLSKKPEHKESLKKLRAILLKNPRITFRNTQGESDD